MSTPVFADALAEVRAEMARLRTAATEARFSRFQPRTLAWLALLPEWTDELARQLDLAGGTADLTHALLEERLIEHREVLTRSGPASAFWLRASVRPDLRRHLVDHGVEVERHLHELVARLSRLEDLPQELEKWISVANRDLKDPTGRALMGEVERLLGAGRISDATLLVATATNLGFVLSGPLAAAAKRAQWRLERAHREAEDQRHLRHYAERRRVEAALDELLSRDAVHWALHLLGAGGVGKTMLVRHLASGDFARARMQIEGPFPVARVDFDHLDPRYPQLRPAELFRALASEIVGYNTTRGSVSAHRRFEDAADTLNEEMARAVQDLAEQTRLRTLMVSSFAKMLLELRQQPVVLVLDTCEELAKLYALGAPAPAIDETFTMLEQLHVECPPVRVLFAGRRSLVPGPDSASAAAGPLLQARPYLRVLRVDGFNREEAESYLDQRSQAQDPPAAPALTEPMREALLKRALLRHGGTATYNPFELASYCDWALNDPRLDPGELARASGDPYVERRILGRLGDGPQQTGLGVAAELGKFDAELPAAAWARAGVDTKAAFDGLAGQEWVNVLSVGTDGRPRVIEIDEHLQERIRRATSANPTRYPVDRRQLGRDASAVVAHGPIGDLPAETVEAAVRLLPVEEGAAFWELVEAKIVEENAWAWAAQVVPRIVASELRRVESGADSILAAVLATQVAGQLHGTPHLDRSKLWRDVASAAARFPADGRDALLARAALGRVADGHDVELDDHAGAVDSHRVPLGSVMAAIEGSLAAGHRPDGPWSWLVEAAASFPEAHTDLGVQAALALARSQAAWLRGDAAEARRSADLAVDLTDRSPGAGRWADWVAPAGHIDRCRAQRLAIALAGEQLAAVPFAQWRREALTRLPEPDARRVVSLSLAFEAGHRPVPAEDLRTVEVHDHRSADARDPARTLPHARLLAVELAEAWGVLGEPEHAQEILDARRELAVERGTEPDVIEQCELALLRLCRRYRSDVFFRSAPRLARDGTPAQRAEAWAMLSLVHGQQPPNTSAAGGWHAWWTCQTGRSILEQPPADVDAPPVAGEPGVTHSEAERDLADFARFLAANPTWAEAWSRAHKGLPTTQALRIAVPAAGEFSEGTPAHAPPGAAGRAGLAAGEVHALRFPGDGAALLERAGEQLLAGDDRLAATQALLLAALAAARAGDRAREERLFSRYEQLGTRFPDREAFQGWRLRREVLRLHLKGKATPAAGERSAELDLVPGRGRTVPSPVAPVAPNAPATAAAGWGPIAPGHAFDGGHAPPPPVAAAPHRPPTPGDLRHRSAPGSPPVGPHAARAVVATLLVVVATAGVGTALVLVGSRSVGFLSPVARITLSAALAAAVLALPVVLVAIWRARHLHRQRVGAAVRFVVRSAGTEGAGREGSGTEMVDVSVVTHRGVADLNAGTMASLGTRLLSGNERRLRTWRAELSLDAMPATMVANRDQFPRARQPRSLTLLQLEVERGLTSLPWERWFRLGLDPSARAVVYRSAGTRPARRLSPAVDTIFSGPAHLAPRPGGRQGVAHLVGTPVRTRAGWRLRVADPFGLGAETSSRGTAPGETLLSVEGLELSFRSLLVLQAEPVDHEPRDLDEMREGFVGLAQSALDAGAPAVLVVPPLPDSLAADVVRLVSHSVSDRRRRPSPVITVDLAARLQGGSSITPPLDVLLFLHH